MLLIWLSIGLLGICAGAACMYLIIQSGDRKSADLLRRAQKETARLAEVSRDIDARRQKLEKDEGDFQKEKLEFAESRKEFDGRAISYSNLQQENRILKRDLQNIDVHLRKLELDGDLRQQRQDMLDKCSKDLANRYLNESIKWIGESLTSNNFAVSKQRLQKVIGWCREVGYEISPAEENEFQANLRKEYELVVRAEFEREEQARIKAQIREEQLRERETQRLQEQLDRERAAIKAALEKALAEANQQHSDEVERLRAKLAEVEERSQRAISQAQMTKAGHVYVISNIGSFGEGIFKIGMTRRLEPRERVDELSCAAVPFPFDIHMMISASDAPTLENALHRALHKQRINKANPRKEFFKVDIETIRHIVEKNHGEVNYVADAEALEFRQSANMSNEDQEFIESAYDSASEDAEPVVQGD